MRQNELDDFIERGWQSGAYLFYKNRAYCFNCCYENNLFRLEVFSFKASIYQKTYFSAHVFPTKTYVDYRVNIDSFYETIDEAKKACLSSLIFEGKSFWQTVDELDWLEDDGPDIIEEEKM